MAGLVPAIHVLLGYVQLGRGCPAQGRAWRAWLYSPIPLVAFWVRLSGWGPL